MIKIKKTFLLIVITLFLAAESNAIIEDSLFVSLENKAITRLDILDEIKIILIVSGKSFSEDKKKQLQATALQSIIKRNIKKIEIEKYESLSFNQKDVKIELNKYANNLNMDIETFKNVIGKNGIKFSKIIDQIKTELLWNSLIFQLYKNRLVINNNEIEEQLKLIQEKKYTEEYLLSEIIIRSPSSENLESRLEELKKKIKTDGFKETAISQSIAETALNGGDLGWIDENIISRNFKSQIINTDIGDISEPIFLSEAILIFKVRDKRKSDTILDLEMAKEKLVNAEKTKILEMYALTHYENIKKNISINYY